MVECASELLRSGGSTLERTICMLFFSLSLNLTPGCVQQGNGSVTFDKTVPPIRVSFRRGLNFRGAWMQNG